MQSPARFFRGLFFEISYVRLADQKRSKEEAAREADGEARSSQGRGRPPKHFAVWKDRISKPLKEKV